MWLNISEEEIEIIPKSANSIYNAFFLAVPEQADSRCLLIQSHIKVSRVQVRVCLNNITT